jgi:nucleoid DNA-binding protein
MKMKTTRTISNYCTTAIEICNIMADEGVGNKSQNRQVMKSFFEFVDSELEKGHDVLVNGFGKFRCIDQAARVMKDRLHNGPDIEVPAKRKVKFKASINIDSKAPLAA